MISTPLQFTIVMTAFVFNAWDPFDADIRPWHDAFRRKRPMFPSPAVHSVVWAFFYFSNAAAILLCLRNDDSADIADSRYNAIFWDYAIAAVLAKTLRPIFLQAEFVIGAVFSFICLALIGSLIGMTGESRHTAARSHDAQTDLSIASGLFCLYWIWLLVLFVWFLIAACDDEIRHYRQVTAYDTSRGKDPDLFKLGNHARMTGVSIQPSAPGTRVLSEQELL